jgi:DNA-binding transcriptional ArsR family regulator
MSASRDETPTTSSEQPGSDDSVDATSVEVESSEPETADELPLDQIFELLKNMRRREVLQYLQETEESVVSIGELAEHIAAIENETTVDAISSSQRKRVYVGLYQCHLPKMDDMGVVDFDQNRGRIEIGRNADQLERFLESDDGPDYPWHRYYGGIAAAGAALLGLNAAGAGQFGLTAEVVLAVVVLAVGGCALLNGYVERPDDA